MPQVLFQENFPHNFQSEEGVGDTPHSFAYDGSRCCKWHKEVTLRKIDTHPTKD